jgi:hypothetical protein
VHGEEFIATRMYGSLREILAGWTKNLATGVPLMVPPIRFVRALAPYLMWLPALFWIAPALTWLLTGWPIAMIATVIGLITWIAIYAMVRAPLWYALLYPFGAACVAFIMIRSALRGGRIEWRGRTYQA